MNQIVMGGAVKEKTVNEERKHRGQNKERQQRGTAGHRDGEKMGFYQSEPDRQNQIFWMRKRVEPIVYTVKNIRLKL